MNDPSVHSEFRIRRGVSRRSLVPMLIALCLGFLFFGVVFGIVIDRTGLLPGSPPTGLGPTFAEAWHVVRDHYVDRSKLDAEQLTQGAITGLVESIGDSGHSAYFTKEQMKELDDSLHGQFEGIGARVQNLGGRPTIMGTLPNSPAEKAGLQSGDVIATVDGKPMEGMPLEQVIARVKGPANTPVVLGILHGSQPEPKDITITRQRIEVPIIAYHALPGVPIGHIAIREFADPTDAQLKAAIAQARKEGMKGLVIDLRRNPGGLRDQAVAVTSEFLKDGDVFIERQADGNRHPLAVLPDGAATDLPICVLIDQGSASSAEILAGAIQDHERGKLIGTRTFGTGTVLARFPLSDGSGVLLAVTEWLTPKGRQIWHKGIKPDIEVLLPDGVQPLIPENEGKLTAESLSKSDDKQLLRAVEELKKQIGS